MGKIEINIPADLEHAIEAAFPGQSKAAVLLRLARSELLKSAVARDVEPEFCAVVDAAMQLRELPPFTTSETISTIRHQLRE